jgi:hypothetical protein
MRPIVTYYLGGMPALAWTWAVPIVVLFHVTCFMNTAGHTWGRRPYATGGDATGRFALPEAPEWQDPWTWQWVGRRRYACRSGPAAWPFSAPQG